MAVMPVSRLFRLVALVGMVLSAPPAWAATGFDALGSAAATAMTDSEMGAAQGGNLLLNPVLFGDASAVRSLAALGFAQDPGGLGGVALGLLGGDIARVNSFFGPGFGEDLFLTNFGLNGSFTAPGGLGLPNVLGLAAFNPLDPLAGVAAPVTNQFISNLVNFGGSLGGFGPGPAAFTGIGPNPINNLFPRGGSLLNGQLFNAFFLSAGIAPPF